MANEFVFIYPKRRLDPARARRAFFVERGRTPTPTEARVEPATETANALRFFVPSIASGVFYVPCLSRREGLIFASTGTLAPSSVPRSLFLELARGQLARLLRKRFEWGTLGLDISRALRATIRRETRRFAALATADRSASEFEEECFAAFESLRATCSRLNDVFLEQASEARRDGAFERSTAFGFAAGASAFRGGKNPFVDPTRSGARRRFRAAFDVFNPTISWADVERRSGAFDWTAFDRALAFAEKRGLRTTFGPLTRWNLETTPRRLVGRSDSEIAEAFLRFVEAAVERAAGRVRRWVVSTNVERSDFAPSSETRFATVEEAARRIRRIDSNAEAFLGFESPFGDAGLFDRSAAGAPWDVAYRFALRRAFDGFYLETNFGLSRLATAPRDPFELHRFFDRWAALGVPLSVAASFPSANPKGPVPTLFSTTAEAGWGRWFGRERRDGERGVDYWLTAPPELEIDESFWSEKTQQENARRFFLTAMARRSVDEAIWSRWDDVGSARDGDFSETASCEATRNKKKGSVSSTRAEAPTSGLFDVDGRPKPALCKLAALKRAYHDRRLDGETGENNENKKKTTTNDDRAERNER
ncbi:MAG: hypothetical protein IKU86_06595 [Thermoguttaceae bacterium]|nr:hypothetical protein [Thermoguttaceae bacterium]